MCEVALPGFADAHGKAELAGVNEVVVYLVREEEKEEDPASIGADPANPTQAWISRLVSSCGRWWNPHSNCMTTMRRPKGA